MAHPPLDDSFAYRFDVVVQGDKDGWSVVMSGDTAPSDAVVQLARGADVLVHEVLLLTGLEEVARWLGRPADHPLVHHVVRSHTTVRDVGRIARDAGVRTLVLSHFVPGDAEMDEAAVRAQIGETFEGEIVLGKDLQDFRPGGPDSAR